MIAHYFLFRILGVQLYRSPGQVRLREDVLVDGGPDQPAAGHQTAQAALHRRPGYRRLRDI